MHSGGIMDLKRFTIMTRNENQQTDEKTSMLINIQHIVSIKPIKLSTSDRDVIDGYWIRLSNGKKYRAIQFPSMILNSLDTDISEIKKNDELEHSFNYQ